MMPFVIEPQKAKQQCLERALKSYCAHEIAIRVLEKQGRLNPIMHR